MQSNILRNTAKFTAALAAVLAATGLLLLVGCGRDATEQQAERDAAPAEVAVTDAIENQQHCPVMDGMKIDRDIYVDHNGKRVYFCCAGCIAAFQAEPEKYMERLHELHADAAPDEQDDAHDHDHRHHH